MQSPRGIFPSVALAAFTLAISCGSGGTSEPSTGSAAPSSSASALPERDTSPAMAAPRPSTAASAHVHVDVTSGASTLQTASRPVETFGEVDGAALRKRHRERLSSDRSPVTVLAGDTALDLGRRICEAVVPKRAPETPVLL